MNSVVEIHVVVELYNKFEASHITERNNKVLWYGLSGCRRVELWLMR